MRIATPVTGAFLAVAFADGRYDKSEERRFLAAIANHPALGCCDTAALQEAYNTLLSEIEGDYAAATARILASIEAVKDEAKVSEAVKVSARGAIVADHVLSPQEEVMLDRIGAALGLEPGAV